MKRILLAALVLLTAATCTWAQSALPERLLLTTGQYVGNGARPMGLGGTYTGVADDYSSVWWNPAGLAQVKRIELQGSLSRTGYGNETSYYGGTDDGSTSSLRLNNIGLVFPVPVYQGALSFAFGYNQVMAFDRRTLVQSPTSGTATWDNFDELETGRLGMWTAAGAVDVSPNLSLGLGLSYWTGLDDYNLSGRYTDNGERIYTETTVKTDLSAWGANIGGMFRAGRYARLGVMFQTPLNMSLEEEWTQSDDNGFVNYRMTYPAVFRVGASFCPGRWLLATDVEYRDWTSLEFRGDTPYDGVSRVSANQQIKKDYQSTTKFSVGGEYLFPAYGLRARAGYSYQPSDYKKAGGEDNRNLFSVGLGVLVDRSVMIDAAVQTTSYTEKITTGLKENVSTTTALVTISYRM
ncbi:hypothetical protein EHM69_09410 [candidate division KSB1 bacterium]|nr:MAG: hypothetical protein EHM69_09410 [candidate division KSB1 bacterium]